MAIQKYHEVSELSIFLGGDTPNGPCPTRSDKPIERGRPPRACAGNAGGRTLSSGSRREKLGVGVTLVRVPTPQCAGTRPLTPSVSRARPHPGRDPDQDRVFTVPLNDAVSFQLGDLFFGISE